MWEVDLMLRTTEMCCSVDCTDSTEVPESIDSDLGKSLTRLARPTAPSTSLYTAVRSAMGAMQIGTAARWLAAYFQRSPRASSEHLPKRQFQEFREQGVLGCTHWS